MNILRLSFLRCTSFTAKEHDQTRMTSVSATAVPEESNTALREPVVLPEISYPNGQEPELLRLSELIRDAYDQDYLQDDYENDVKVRKLVLLFEKYPTNPPFVLVR